MGQGSHVEPSNKNASTADAATTKLPPPIHTLKSPIHPKHQSPMAFQTNPMPTHQKSNQQFNVSGQISKLNPGGPGGSKYAKQLNRLNFTPNVQESDTLTQAGKQQIQQTLAVANAIRGKNKSALNKTELLDQ